LITSTTDAPDGELSFNFGDGSQQRSVAKRTVVLRRRRPAVDVVPVAEQLGRRVAVWRRFANADVDDDG